MRLSSFNSQEYQTHTEAPPIVSDRNQMTVQCSLFVFVPRSLLVYSLDPHSSSELAQRRSGDSVNGLALIRVERFDRSRFRPTPASLRHAGRSRADVTAVTPDSDVIKSGVR